MPFVGSDGPAKVALLRHQFCTHYSSTFVLFVLLLKCLLQNILVTDITRRYTLYQAALGATESPAVCYQGRKLNLKS